MRALKAKQISTGSWFQRIDTGGKQESVFSQEVADQFSIPVNDVQVLVGQLTPAEYDTAVAEMGTGVHQGIPVTAAPILPPTDEEKRKAASQVIFGNNQGQGVGVMSLPALSQMVIAMGQLIGVIDENGDVI